MKLDWWAINSTLLGAGIVLLWFWLMVLIGQHAAWSHQAAHAALAGFR
jgi:hypothetical protein